MAPGAEMRPCSWLAGCIRTGTGTQGRWWSARSSHPVGEAAATATSIAVATSCPDWAGMRRPGSTRYWGRSPPSRPAERAGYSRITLGGGATEHPDRMGRGGFLAAMRFSRDALGGSRTPNPLVRSWVTCMPPPAAQCRLATYNAKKHEETRVDIPPDTARYRPIGTGMAPKRAVDLGDFLVVVEIVDLAARLAARRGQ